MSLDEILKSAQFVIDGAGEKTAVQLDLAVWQQVVDLLHQNTPPFTIVETKSGDWQEMMRLIEETSVDTGIEDLAEEHDHYLYGKPKNN